MLAGRDLSQSEWSPCHRSAVVPMHSRESFCFFSPQLPPPEHYLRACPLLSCCRWRWRLRVPRTATLVAAALFAAIQCPPCPCQCRIPDHTPLSSSRRSTPSTGVRGRGRRTSATEAKLVGVVLRTAWRGPSEESLQYYHGPVHLFGRLLPVLSDGTSRARKS